MVSMYTTVMIISTTDIQEFALLITLSMVIALAYLGTCWVLLEFLEKLDTVVNVDTTWPEFLFLYVSDYLCWWFPFEKEAWLKYPPFLGPDVNPWVLFIAWALPDRIATLRQDVGQNLGLWPERP